MAVTINNRYDCPDSVVPITLISGATVDGQVGMALVQYTVDSSSGATLTAGEFGFLEVLSAIRIDAAGASAALTDGGVATGATNGTGVILAIGTFPV